MPQRGDSVKPTRFRGPTVVTLRGAASDVLTVGAGADTGMDIQIPWSQSANPFQISRPDGSLLYAISAYGGQTVTTIALTASGAVPPNLSASFVITAGAAAALTLVAPTQNGIIISITSATAFAHTLTATGLLGTGSAAVNVATFAAHPGASLTLVSYGGIWMVQSQNGIAFS